MALAALIGAGWISPMAAGTAFLATQTVGIFRSMLGVTLMTRHLQTFRSRRDMWRLLGWAVVANWGYRQLTLVWRIRSLLPGSTGWGEMPRAAGFKVAAAATPG